MGIKIKYPMTSVQCIVAAKWNFLPNPRKERYKAGWYIEVPIMERLNDPRCTLKNFKSKVEWVNPCILAHRDLKCP